MQAPRSSNVLCGGSDCSWPCLDEVTKPRVHQAMVLHRLRPLPLQPQKRLQEVTAEEDVIPV